MAAFVVGGALTLATSAYADIIFTPGNNPQPNEENVQFEAPDEVPAFTQSGDTNQTATPVFFTTVFAPGVGSNGGGGSNQLIVSNGIGQGDIVTASGAQLTSMQITPGTGLGWHDFIANPTHGEGTMNVYVLDNMGNNFDFTLGQGQDFFTLTTANNEAITEVQLTQQTGTPGPFGWDDFAQPRVSGVCTLGTSTCEPVTPTPEPGSLALLASGLVGLVGVARRRFRVG